MVGSLRIQKQSQALLWCSLALCALIGLLSHDTISRVDAASSGYHLLQTISVIPSDGRWDYATVDTVNRHVYFSHGEETVVLDADSGQVVAKIPAPESGPSIGLSEPGRNTPFMGVHHVAIAEDLGRGFVSNGRAGSSTIFDLKTFKKLGEVSLTGKDPNAIIYDAATKRVFTFNEGTNNSTVIDARSGKVVGTIPLNARPAFAASDDKGHVFVNLIEKGSVLRINSHTMVAGDEWPVAVCGGPYNETMAIDKKNSRLFVGCRPDYRQMTAPAGPRPNRVMAVLDTNSGRVVTTVPIGGNPDQAAFDPETGLAFSANGEGNVTVIKEESPEKFTVLETVTTQPGAARLAVDPKTHKLFVPNADPGAIPPPTSDNPSPPPSLTRNFRIMIFGM